MEVSHVGDEESMLEPSPAASQMHFSWNLYLKQSQNLNPDIRNGMQASQMASLPLNEMRSFEEIICS